MRHQCEICQHRLTPREKVRSLFRLRPARAEFISGTGAHCTRFARWICTYCETTWVQVREPLDEWRNWARPQ